MVTTIGQVLETDIQIFKMLPLYSLQSLYNNIDSIFDAVIHPNSNNKSLLKTKC